MPRCRLLAAAAGLVVALVGCTSGDEPAAAPATWTTAATTTTTTTVEVIEVDDVYAVPDPLPPGEPGEVIQVEPRGEVAGVPGSMGWRVLYHSRSVHGEDIAVSGTILRPAGDAPEGGFPVLSWAHGTTGTADGCAPSMHDPRIPALAELLAAGYVVAATDYEGLGTPGLHPYLLGGSEGRGVLDAARAAHSFDPVDAGEDVVVWGHSQGGHAALFAGELAPAYAPELDVRGVVAIAPAGDLEIVVQAALGSVFGFMLAGTWAEEYPSIDLEALLTPEARALLPLLDELCTPALAGELAELPAGVAQPGVAPLELDPFGELVVESSAGHRPVEPPILVVHGDGDELIPVALSELLVPALCGVDADAELRTYPGATHSSILDAAATDVLAWTADRFAGAATSGCASP